MNVDRLTFTLTDSNNDIVGCGTTASIMIVDDRSNALNEGVSLTGKRRRGDSNTRGANAPEARRPAKRICHSDPEPSGSDIATSLSGDVTFEHTDILPPPVPPDAFWDDDQRQCGPSLEMPPDMVSSSAPCISQASWMHAEYPRPPPQPLITSIFPHSGPLLGGTEVMVHGVNFEQHSKAVFGGTVATSTEWLTPQTLRCITPPSAIPGAVVVSIEGVVICIGGGSDLGGSDGRLLQWFEYDAISDNDL